MKIFLLSLFSIVFVLGVFGISTCIAIPINVGSSGSYTYDWNLITEKNSPKFTIDAMQSGNVAFGWEYYPRAYLYVTGTDGFVEWHFQTYAEHVFADDVMVKSNVAFYNSTGKNSVIAEWSNDGSNYNQFYNFIDTTIYHEGINPGFISLSDSGYTGGNDLYIRFNLHREVGNIISVQLFRSAPGDSQFVVTGSVIPNPEPTTMFLFGSGLIGLAGFSRRFKKS